MSEQQTAAVPAPAEQAVPAEPAEAPSPPPPRPCRRPRPPRRALRAVARWTVALLVFGGLGTGTALAITSAERTDVPGLATESDGRWDYPKLSLPRCRPARPARSPTPTPRRSTTRTCGSCCCPLRRDPPRTRRSTAAG
ncbi:hypothetical protein ACN24M_18865 [Streptomyces microflavus]